MADEQGYTILVMVRAKSQREAFRFVEKALEEHMEKHEDLAPERVHVYTANGLHSTEL